MRGVAPGETALHAGVAAIGLAVFPGHHAHHFLAFYFGLEAAAHAAIGASRDDRVFGLPHHDDRSEEHTSELQSLMRISYAVFCLKKKKHKLYIQIPTLTHIIT